MVEMPQQALGPQVAAPLQAHRYLVISVSVSGTKKQLPCRGQHLVLECQPPLLPLLQVLRPGSAVAHRLSPHAALSVQVRNAVAPLFQEDQNAAAT